MPGGEGVLAVRARLDDGSPEIALATLEPTALKRVWPVAVAALAGRTVRIVLDPVPALGTSLDVLRVGPVTAPLPGWRLESGTLDLVRRALRVTDAPLRVVSPPVRARRGVTSLTVALRGDGIVRADAGGRSVAARAGARWALLRVPLPRRAPVSVRLRVSATPGPGALELRSLGVARRPARSGGSGSR